MTKMFTDIEDVPDEIREAIAPIGHDLAIAEIRVSIERVAPNSAPPHLLGMGTQHAQVRLAGRVVGQIGIDLTNSVPYRTWHLADQIQGYILETPWKSGRATTWPRCISDHPHPMRPAVQGEEVWWVCPRDESTRVHIGDHPGHLPTAGHIANG
jgi:hypothetical protein